MNIDILCANALKTKFSEQQIYHDNLPDSGVYPMVMYTDVSESPVSHCDDRLYGREHIIRVTLVTSGNATINALKEEIEKCMVDAGFMWVSTNKIHDKNEYFTSLDFSIGYLAN